MGSYPFFFCRKADQTAAQKGDILLLMGTDNRQLSGCLLFYKFDDLSSCVLIQTGKPVSYTHLTLPTKLEV